MLNFAIAHPAEIGGRSAVEARVGAVGNLLFGPYEQLAAGRYQVEFTFELRGGVPGHDVAAIVDVVSDVGQTCIALDYISSARIASGAAITLEFDLDDTRTIECRVASTGQAHIAVADQPAIASRASDRPARTRFCRHGSDQLAREHGEPMRRMEDILGASGVLPHRDERELARSLSAALRPLRPQRVIGHGKIRIGGDGDGGYVCVDDLDGIDTVLSLGIDHNVEFDDDIASRGATIYQFDHTVDAPRPDDSRMVFEKKMIAVHPGMGVETLPTLVRRHDRGGDRPNIFLKIDIENYEWPVFDAVEDADLKRIRQITGEFHAFEFFVYPQWRDRALRVLGKLARNFALVHVHGNNCAAVSQWGDVIVPNVLEMTLVNREYYRLSESDEIFPGKLDQPCAIHCADIQLGSFSY